MDLTGEIINGRYRIGEMVACGATGEVYEAVQETLGRKVAVKVMRMDIPMESYSLAMERFRHEAKVTALLKHPNIVTVFDYGCTFNGRLFIVMEWVGGQSLRQLIKGKPLGLERTIPLFRQILMGLESAHEAGLIHRDLKPDNIKVSVDQTGRKSVKVLDFGLSVQRTLPLPSPGTWVVGSPGYMSPEQAGGQSVDVRHHGHGAQIDLVAELFNATINKSKAVGHGLRFTQQHLPLGQRRGIVGNVLHRREEVIHHARSAGGRVGE